MKTLKKVSICLLFIVTLIFPACFSGGGQKAVITAKTIADRYYEAGDVMELLVSNMFTGVTEKTSYSTDKGEIVSGKLVYVCISLGRTVIKVTASENGSLAVASVNVHVSAKVPDPIVPDVPEEPEEPDVPDVPEDPNAVIAEKFKARAAEYGRKIKELYFPNEAKVSKLTPEGGTPALWPYTENLGMCNGLLEIMDPAKDAEDYAFFRSYLEQAIEGIRYYRVGAGRNGTTAPFGKRISGSSTAAYSSGSYLDVQDSAYGDKGAIFFDDNIWVAKEFLRAYKNTGSTEYLNECLNVVDFILSEGMETAVSSEGEFEGTPMNGIYWNWGAKDKHIPGVYQDSQTASLNTCATAPTAAVLFELAGEVTGTKADNYRQSAEKLYAFAKAVLKNGEGLYSDKVFVKENAGRLYLEHIDGSTYSYNSGCMITAGAINGDTVSAAFTASAANGYFARRYGSFYSYGNQSWFNSLLLEGFIAAKEDAYIQNMADSLDRAWSLRSSDGLCPPDWPTGFYGSTDISESNHRQILLQTANAHCMAMLAAHYSAKAV